MVSQLTSRVDLNVAVSPWIEPKPGNNCQTTRQFVPDARPDAKNVSPDALTARQDAQFARQDMPSACPDASFVCPDTQNVSPDASFARQDVPFVSPNTQTTPPDG